MKFISPALFLILTGSVTDAWNIARFSPYATSLMRPTVVWSPSVMLRQQQELMNRASRGFTQTSPRYEITNNEEKFQVAVDVPGMTSNDISIAIEEDGQLLTIKGSRESASESYRFTSKFSQSFSIDPTVDVEKFTASLDNGVLVVSAPKDLKRIEESVRSIPITELSSATNEAPKVQNDQKAEVEHDTAVEHTDETETLNLDEVNG